MKQNSWSKSLIKDFLIHKIENFSKFSLLLPFCMIEHDFVPIQENDEES